MSMSFLIFRSKGKVANDFQNKETDYPPKDAPRRKSLLAAQLHQKKYLYRMNSLIY